MDHGGLPHGDKDALVLVTIMMGGVGGRLCVRFSGRFLAMLVMAVVRMACMAMRVVDNSRAGRLGCVRMMGAAAQDHVQQKRGRGNMGDERLHGQAKPGAIVVGLLAAVNSERLLVLKALNRVRVSRCPFRNTFSKYLLTTFLDPSKMTLERRS
jgi:hypothetical protein